MFRICHNVNVGGRVIRDSLYALFIFKSSLILNDTDAIQSFRSFLTFLFFKMNVIDILQFLSFTRNSFLL